MGAYDFGPYKLAKPRMGRLPDDRIPTPEELRINWAIGNIQAALLDAGFSILGDWVEGIFGRATHDAVKDFQAAMGYKKDGECGRMTNAALFGLLVAKVEAERNIPDSLLCGLIAWESLWDPSAVGWADPQDRGLAQINSHWHPDVSDLEAFNAVFAIEWAANRLKSAHNKFKKDCHDVAWDCAIANHNSPADANLWCETGSPPDEQIANYVAGIRRMCV
jgi:hypothetical protein